MDKRLEGSGLILRAAAYIFLAIDITLTVVRNYPAILEFLQLGVGAMKYRRGSLATYLTVFGGVFVGAMHASSAATFQNGDFETPSIGNTFYTLYSTGSTSITGWTVVGPNGGDVAIIGQGGNPPYNPESGLQFIDLTGVSNTAGEGLSQTFDTTAGNTYQVSFWVGNALRDGSVTSTVDAIINGGSSVAYTNSQSDPVNNYVVWQEFTTTFVASGSSSTLELLNGDPASDSLNGLDNVSVVNEGVSATPIPGALPLFASGLGAMGFFGWRRKRKISAATATA